MAKGRYDVKLSSNHEYSTTDELTKDMLEVIEENSDSFIVYDKEENTHTYFDHDTGEVKRYTDDSVVE